MYKNIFFVCSRNDIALKELKLEIEKTYKNVLSVDTNRLTKESREAFFMKSYTHVPPDEILNSREYLYIFKNIERIYIESAIDVLCENNKDFNIFIYGDYFIQMGDVDWIKRMRNKYKDWKVSCIYLSEEKISNEEHSNFYYKKESGYKKFMNKLIEKIQENDEVSKISNTREINHLVAQKN